MADRVIPIKKGERVEVHEDRVVIKLPEGRTAAVRKFRGTQYPSVPTHIFRGVVRQLREDGDDAA